MKLARDIEFENYTNGKGIRMIIWNQGCKIHCPGCHNPESWNLKDGKDFEIDYLKSEIKEHSKNHLGITLSGGDPFLQPQENKELAIYARSLGLNVWAYSGQLFEKLKENKDTLELLKNCDVLVDGPFVLSQRDITLPFKGSPNQRTIDVQKSLEKNDIVLYIK